MSKLTRLLSAAITLAASTVHATAADNLLKDPGFERFHLCSESKCYRPDNNAAWRVVGDGGSSIRFDASGWEAPEAMTTERPLGFTPGAHGFVGHGPDANSGVLSFEQDIVAPEQFRKAEQYQAWVWLGGAGHDDDQTTELKDERGGWEIIFYPSADPATWTDKIAIERHYAEFDYWGKPGSFVRVSGHGRVPKGARGARMRVHAATWRPVKAGDYDTKVAVDNAHFSILEPNLLVNGDFEQDEEPVEFKGWTRPAKYDFPMSTLEPIDIDNAYNKKAHWDHNFDHGLLLPFHGGRWAYGYSTYRCGWKKDAFTFSQDVKYQSSTGPLMLMCYWIQNTKGMHTATQFRDGAGSSLQFVLQYYSGRELIRTEALNSQWPIASNPKNRHFRDQNPWTAFHPKFRIEPPEGTDRITLNVSVMVDLEYDPKLDLVVCAVDHFYLGPAVAGD